MDHRQLMRMLAAGRVVVGTSLVLAPGFGGSRWIGDPARSPQVKVVTRALGVRDLSLGLGALQALETGESAREWVLLGALCDAVDVAATIVAVRALGLRRALPIIAVGAASIAASVVSADQLD